MEAVARDYESLLEDHIAKFVYDPLGFVHYIYPWGEGVLNGEDGPDEWQSDILRIIGEQAQTEQDAIQIAVRSGRGIGKTACMAWIIHWFMSTRPHCQIVVTANTKEQLTNKTWRELAKWWKLSLNEHWFDWTATKFSHKQYRETWFASATPWSKEKSEAFQGTHEKYVVLLMDEASAIEDIIWEAAEGTLTTPGNMWIVFGNPTRNTGRFFECFNKYRKRWITREIDSRTAKKANQSQIQKWIADYGDDSDWVRVMVKGQEPRAGTLQFIPGDLVSQAMSRNHLPDVYQFAPKILGCDVAWYGDDRSVVVCRQGLKVTDMWKMREVDPMNLAHFVASKQDELRAELIFVDVVGMGAGVFSALQHMRRPVFAVNGGERAMNHYQFADKNAEMWDSMKKWFEEGGQIPNDTELRDDLIGREYGYTLAHKLRLESKQDMKKRGLASPDCADALAFTFAMPVHIPDYEEETGWAKQEADVNLGRDSTTGY